MGDFNYLPQIISPSASELGRYGRTPVSLHSGLADIAVPLTEVRGKNYKLPVSLRYYTGGNRPDQHPGWVGQGWSLQAGGCITRVVNGMKDEMSKEEFNVRNGVTPSEDPGYIYHMEETQNGKNWNSEAVLKESASYVKEYEPDEYLINIPGISASFCIVGESDIRIMSKNESAIRLVSYEIGQDNDATAFDMYPGQCEKPLKARRYKYLKSFVVSDKLGNLYYFGGDDSAIEYSVFQLPNLVINGTQVVNTGLWRAIATANTWMLTKIELTNGEVVKFEYEKDGVPIVLRDVHHGELYRTDDMNPIEMNTDTYERYLLNIKVNLNFSFLLPSYLKRISCVRSGDELTFETTQSTELPYDINRDDFNKYVGDFSSIATLGPFTFEDFQANNYYRQLTRITGTHRDIRLGYTEDESTRLKLLSIRFLDGDTEDRRYGFSYNTVSLPAYNSRKTDIWGYYNNIDYSSELGSFGHTLDETRVPSEQYMVAEMLTSISYPTGGRTDFEYEAHRYSKKATVFPFAVNTVATDGIAGGLRIKKITDYSDGQIVRQRTFEYTEDGRSSGVLNSLATNYVTGRHKVLTQTLDYEASFGMYSELPVLPLSESDCGVVTYGCVKETYSSGGSIEYRFSNYDEDEYMDAAPKSQYGLVSGCPIHPEFTSGNLHRGLLLSRTVYRSDGSAVVKEEYNYTDVGTGVLKSVSQDDYCGGNIFLISYVERPCDYPALNWKRVTRYTDDDNTLIDTHSYLYKSGTRLNYSYRLSRSGYSKEERIYYPEDRDGDIYEAMNTGVMFGVPIGRAEILDSYVVKGTELVFKELAINPEPGSARTIYVPYRMFTTRMSSPVGIGAYENNPSAYLCDVPDVEFKLYDEYANVLLAGFNDGSQCEYHWGARHCDLGMTSRMARYGGDTYKSGTLPLTYAQTPSLDISFTTGNASSVVNCRLSVNYQFACLAMVVLDGETYGMVQYSVPQQPDAKWTGYLNTYPNSVQVEVPAGNHRLMIYISDELTSTSDTQNLGQINYSYYEESVVSQKGIFQDFEIAVEKSMGFHSAKGHTGQIAIKYPVESGKKYLLDYFIRVGASWEFRQQEYNGSSTTIGSRTSVIDNVRIYPVDSLTESYCHMVFDGMSAKTDGKGVSESYRYDGCGRLCGVDDNSDNPTAGYAYSYPATSAARGSVTTDIYTAAAMASSKRTVDYFDGLGNLIQNVAVDAGGQGWDVVSRKDYDGFGRLYREWLPAPVQSGSGRSAGAYATESQILSGGNQVYPADDTVRHTLSVYEDAPEERKLEQFGAGSDWRQGGKKLSYALLANENDSASLLSARLYDISFEGGVATLERNALASASGSLVVNRTVDEDGRTTMEFYDIYGNLVLKRCSGTNSSDILDTYFVYDAFGRLAAVIPPKLAKELESSGKSSWQESEISHLAYLYRYDSRGNCIAKLLPGGGWTYYIFDSGNRCVLSQDAVQRQNNEWSFVFTDLFGRECISGTAVLELDVEEEPLLDTAVYVSLPASPSYGGILKGYTLSGLSLGSVVSVLNVNYYDSYGFLGQTPFPAATDPDVSYDSDAESEFGARYSVSVRGVAAGSLTRILDGGSQSVFLWKVSYYDEKGRPVQIRKSTHTGGVEKEYFKYDFTGNVLKRKTIHVKSDGSQVTEVRTMTYDNMGRLLTVGHSVGGSVAKTVSDRQYDRIGRLSGDNRNGQSGLSESRTYDIRSMLRSIGGQLFSESLKYQDGAVPSWSGFISENTWTAGTEGLARTYRYSYDFAARLTSASYLEGSVAKASFSGSYQYDAGGNLTSITEGGTTLSPVISGNRIDRIGTSACTYDAKGRQISSAHDGRTVVYNLLDRPQKITLSGGKVIDYKYAADGTKLQEKTTSGGSVKTVDYVGNCIYEDGILKKILLDGAYASLSGSQVSYHFFLRDHLGSIRVVASEAGAVEQVNHYYPYGSRFSAGGGDNRFLYTGKELNPDSALYDFHARLMSPATGRFVTLDPDAEKYRSVSPYAYCAGNPINLVDSEGKAVIVVNIVGGVVSAVINYGGQVVANIITYDEEDKKNKSIWDAFKDVDCFDIGIAFGEGFATAGGSVVKSGAKSGMKLLRSLLNASKKDVIIVAGSEVLSNTFDYEKGEFKVNSFKDVQYKTFIGLSSDLLIPGIDRSFRPLKTTTVNQSMKRAMKDSKYTPELYSKVRARTNASNALKTGLNDVAEDAVHSSTTDVGKSVIQKLYDKDSEEEELKYGW